MKVIVLYNGSYYDRNVDEVFTPEAWEQKKLEFLNIQKQEFKNKQDKRAVEIAEKDKKRKDLIHEADSTLDKERQAKEEGNWAYYKASQKNRKACYKLANDIQWEINKLQRISDNEFKMTDTEIIDYYMDWNSLSFEEFDVTGV